MSKKSQTHRAVLFTGLYASRVVVAYAASSVPFSFSPDVDLFENLDIPSHTGSEFSSQMNKVSGSWTDPEIGWLLVVDLLQRETRHKHLEEKTDSVSLRRNKTSFEACGDTHQTGPMIELETKRPKAVASQRYHKNQNLHRRYPVGEERSLIFNVIKLFLDVWFVSDALSERLSE